MNKELSSSRMVKGVIRNGTIILVSWVLFFITPPEYGLPVDLVIGGFIISNLISLFENMVKMGIDVPKSITDKLKVMKDKEENPNNIK